MFIEIIICKKIPLSGPATVMYLRKNRLKIDLFFYNQNPGKSNGKILEFQLDHQKKKHKNQKNYVVNVHIDSKLVKMNFPKDVTSLYQTSLWLFSKINGHQKTFKKIAVFLKNKIEKKKLTQHVGSRYQVPSVKSQTL